MTAKIRAAILADADNLPKEQVEAALKKLPEICNSKTYGPASFLDLLRHSQIYALEPAKNATRMKLK